MLLALVSIKTAEDLRRFIQVVILSAVLTVVYDLALAAMHGTILRVINSECTLIIAFAAFANSVLMAIERRISRAR